MTELQPSKPNELGHEYRTILADLYIAAHNGGKAEPLLAEASAKLLALLHPTTNSGKTTYSHTDVDGNYDEIEEAVNQILYHKILKPSDDTTVRTEPSERMSPDVKTTSSNTSNELEQGIWTIIDDHKPMVDPNVLQERLERYIQSLLDQRAIDELERLQAEWSGKEGDYHVSWATRQRLRQLREGDKT